MWCFSHFALEMCFAPQRRALFRHVTFQKWSAHVVLFTFCLGNVPRATTVCTFSTIQILKVVREQCALWIWTWKCASRHNVVHRHQSGQGGNDVFSGFGLGDGLQAPTTLTVCNCSSLIWSDGSAPAAFSSLLFEPLKPQITGETECFAT